MKGLDTFRPLHCVRMSSGSCMNLQWFDSIMLGNECSARVEGLYSLLVWTSMLSLMVGTRYMQIWSRPASLVSSKRNLFIV